MMIYFQNVGGIRAKIDELTCSINLCMHRRSKWFSWKLGYLRIFVALKFCLMMSMFSEPTEPLKLVSIIKNKAQQIYVLFKNGKGEYNIGGVYIPHGALNNYIHH